MLANSEQLLTIACIAVFLEAMVLNEVISKIASLKHRRSSPESPARVVGARIPAFSARILDSSRVISERDLIGKSTALFFLEAREALSWSRPMFLATVQSVRDKTYGLTYVVCRGADDECRALRDQCHLMGSHGNDLIFMADTNLSVSGKFNATSTPSALLINESGRVERHGIMTWSLADNPSVVLTNVPESADG